MGETSKISWTDSTFNPWHGCTKIEGSPACDNCYAESFSASVGFGHTPKDAAKFPIWGAHTQRRFFGDKHWNDPLRWNRAAEKAGETKFVFCASMADWAEGRPDQAEHLQRLWQVQGQTRSLRWLMLTKRPQLINKLVPGGGKLIDGSWSRRWHGITAETQAWFDIRWRHLRDVASPVYWLSMEPLFERIKLPDDYLSLGQRAWVIVGGESGRNARTMHPGWARYLRDQCVEAGVPFFFKQWGEYAPWINQPMTDPGRRYIWADGKVLKHGESNGGVDFRDAEIMNWIGTKEAGHLLDGVEWHQRPLA